MVKEKFNEKIIKCPKCKVNLEKFRSPNKKYILDGCNKCGGLWLDKNEIANISKQSFWQYILNYFR